MFRHRKFHLIDPTIKNMVRGSSVTNPSLRFVYQLCLTQAKILYATIPQFASIVIVSYVQRDFLNLLKSLRDFFESLILSPRPALMMQPGAPPHYL